MKTINWIAALLAIAVLGLTLYILFTLRVSTVRGLDSGIANIVASFHPASEILGEPTDAFADFEAAESLVSAARRNPFLRDIVVTKLFDSGEGLREVPVVPFDLLAERGGSWRDAFLDWSAFALEQNGRVHGFLYLDVDRSAVASISRAIVAVALALVASLLVLIGRLFSQQTTLHRVGSELEQRKRELIRIERLALAGQLTANLLHDLKKPVLNIRHQIEDIQVSATGLSVEEVGRLKSGMNDQVRLFLQMLNDTSIERFVKSDRVSEEYADVNELVRASVRLVHYERGGAGLEEALANDLPAILVQPFRLIQVFSNLILNAYQAMRGSGTLRLESRRVDGGIEVLVRDTGPGIAPEIVESVFDPFFTTKAESEGSGLGLAISRLIVEGLGGKISVESPAGGPTTFRVWLPERPHLEPRASGNS